MVLAFDTDLRRMVGDARDARTQPRSLDLALARMGFSPRRAPLPGWRWPPSWSGRERDDAAPDWRPV